MRSGALSRAITAAMILAGLGAAAPDAAARPGARRRVVSSSSSIVILEPIRFVGVASAIDPRSGPMLDAIAQTFVDNTDLELIEVRAYGPIGYERALRVRNALVARGVARARLRAVGVPTSSAAASPGPEFVIIRRRNGT